VSVYIRKGSPYYWYEFKIDGQRFRGSTEQTSKRAAEQAEKRAKEAARDKLAANALEPDRMTLDMVLGRYWSEHGHRTKAAKEIKSHFENIIAIVGRTRIYCELGSADVADFVRQRREKGAMKWMGEKRGMVRVGEISDGSIANALTTWQSVHTMARDIWELPVRPIAWRKIRPQRSRNRISSITESTARSLFCALPTNIQAIAMFSLGTGCRKGQAFELRVKDVDIPNRRVTVQKQKRKGQETETKVLSDIAMVGLAMAYRADAGPEDYVFDVSNFRKAWEAARKEVGIPDFNFHDLRHTFATWLGDRGASIQAVSKALGHSSVAVTMRYLEVFERHQAQAVALLPQLDLTAVASDKVADADDAKTEQCGTHIEQRSEAKIVKYARKTGT
jgi:integrase